MGRTAAIVAAAAFTVMTWGTAYTAIRVAVRSYSPGALALCRFGIGSVVLGACTMAGVQRTRFTRPTWREGALLVSAGVFGVAIYSVLLNSGERTVTAGTTALLLSASPVFVALLVMPTLGERLDARGWSGVALGFAGTATIAASSAGGIRVGPGVPTVLLAALSWAIYCVIQKAALARFTPLEVTAYSFWAGTAVLLPWTRDLLVALRTAPPIATAAVIYLGVVPAGFAFLTWAYVCARMTAYRAAATSYLIVPIGLIVAWLALGEVPRLTAIGGGVATLIGVWIVNSVRRDRADRAG